MRFWGSFLINLIPSLGDNLHSGPRLTPQIHWFDLPRKLKGIVVGVAQITRIYEPEVSSSSLAKAFTPSTQVAQQRNASLKTIPNSCGKYPKVPKVVTPVGKADPSMPSHTTQRQPIVGPRVLPCSAIQILEERCVEMPIRETTATKV